VVAARKRERRTSQRTVATTRELPRRKGRATGKCILRGKLAVAKSCQQVTAVAVRSARVCEVTPDLRRDRTHSALARKMSGYATLPSKWNPSVEGKAAPNPS
jgi:hypothetical protein